MTDPDRTPADDSAHRTQADDLADAVAELGDTPEDQLATIDERNDSLEERLPDEDLGGDGSRPARSPEKG